MAEVDWGFEGPYAAQDGIPQVQVPSGWRAWWVEGDPCGEGVEGHYRPETGPVHARDF